MADNDTLPSGDPAAKDVDDTENDNSISAEVAPGTAETEEISKDESKMDTSINDTNPVKADTVDGGNAGQEEVLKATNDGNPESEQNEMEPKSKVEEGGENNISEPVSKRQDEEGENKPEPTTEEEESRNKPDVEETDNKPAEDTENVSNEELDNTLPTSSRTLTPQCAVEECQHKDPDKDDKEDKAHSHPIEAESQAELPSATDSQQQAVKKAAISPELPTFHSGPVPARSAQRSRTEIHASSSLNQLAIAASAQNKLPSSRLKDILERVGRHTEASAGKRGVWYKSETGYVDMNSYSWKNMALYKDYQQHMWSGNGTIKTTCRK